MPISVITPAGKSLQVKRARIILPAVADQTAATPFTQKLFGLAKDDVLAYFTVQGLSLADSTSAVMDVGVTGNAEKYITDLDVNVELTTAVIRSGTAGSVTGATEAANQIIVSSITPGTGDAAGGPMYVNMYYYSVNRGEV